MQNPTRKPDTQFPQFPQPNPNPNPNPKLILQNPMKPIRPCQNSVSRTSDDPVSTNSSTTTSKDELMKVARSVVAGFLLKRFEQRGIFTPIYNREILFHFNDQRLLCASEKDALKNLGKPESNSGSGSCSGSGSGSEDIDDEEFMVTGITSALQSIESDTGGVTCGCGGRMNGKDILFVMGIEPEKLVQELLPPSLTLEELTLSSEDMRDKAREEYRKWRKKEVRKVLLES